MLTKEDLLVCTTPPNIKDEVFHYSFLDGTELDVEFTEWGIYHMLGIQHINGKIVCKADNRFRNFFVYNSASILYNEHRISKAGEVYGKD